MKILVSLKTDSQQYKCEMAHVDLERGYFVWYGLYVSIISYSGEVEKVKL